MFHFFASQPRTSSAYVLDGENFNHLVNVLRIKVGENILVSFDGKTDLCSVTKIEQSSAIASVIEENYQDTALPISITLMQGLPKSDKMELIIQKAVELGADAVIPVETQNSVVKLIGNKKDNKINRWQAIAKSGAEQSKRNIVPKVGEVITFKQAIESAKDYDLVIMPYECENGVESTKSALSKIKSGMKIAVIIGPEGGFSEKEVLLAKEKGIETVSLGKRILRTETASITTLSMLMLYAEMYL